MTGRLNGEAILMRAWWCAALRLRSGREVRPPPDDRRVRKWFQAVRPIEGARPFSLLGGVEPRRHEDTKNHTKKANEEVDGWR